MVLRFVCFPPSVHCARFARCFLLSDRVLDALELAAPRGGFGEGAARVFTKFMIFTCAKLPDGKQSPIWNDGAMANPISVDRLPSTAPCVCVCLMQTIIVIQSGIFMNGGNHIETTTSLAPPKMGMHAWVDIELKRAKKLETI